MMDRNLSLHVKRRSNMLIYTNKIALEELFDARFIRFALFNKTQRWFELVDRD